jgi:hypothetical protein
MQEYFPAEVCAALEASLLEYGKQVLGCVGITPIWLSYYVGVSANPLMSCALLIQKFSWIYLFCSLL